MSEPVLDRNTIIPFIAEIFERRGADSYLGEPVTMSQHMLQGAVLAERDSAAEELVAAALLHDIGHYTSEFGPLSDESHDDNYHDEAGARVLEGFFPPVVIECVRLHVAAKRYLCAAEPDYFARLSPDSVRSLSLQDGPMSPEEMAAFRVQPHAEAAVQLRRFNESAKVRNLPTPPVEHFLPFVRACLKPAPAADAG